MRAKENIDPDTAPRDISIHIRGRYPGSQDLTYHLPMNLRIHSGIRNLFSSSLIRPHLLTVAGAAQAYRKSLFRDSLTWFPFNSTAAKRSKHLKRGGHSTRIMRYGLKTSRNEAAVACISTCCLKLHLKDGLIS